MACAGCGEVGNRKIVVPKKGGGEEEVEVCSAECEKIVRRNRAIAQRLRE